MNCDFELERTVSMLEQSFEMRSTKKAAAKTTTPSKGRKSECSSKNDHDEEELKKGPWAPEEDELLAKYIAKQGEGGWRTLPKRAGLRRCGKSCRLRWMNYLRPNVKRGHISPDEEDLILRLHRLLGNRWSLIAGRIPGRTDNEIKNYWNTHLSKKLIRQGIDPRTHKPFSGPLNIPPNPIHKLDHSNSKLYVHYSSTSNDLPPNVKNPNSTTTNVSKRSTTSRRAHRFCPPVISQTHVSSPKDDDNNKNELITCEQHNAEEQVYQYDNNSKAVNSNLTKNTATEITMGLDSSSNIINQRICPNCSANNLRQLLPRPYDIDHDDDMTIHDHSGDGDDDVFSSFFNSLINDDMIFHCNTVDEAITDQENGSQPCSNQCYGVIPGAPPAQGRRVGERELGEEESNAVIMNITSPSFGFQKIVGSKLIHCCLPLMCSPLGGIQ